MKYILTTVLLISLFASCKKDVDELPPATQTGAHTFGAKVNGELWVPQGFGAIPANDKLEAMIYSNGDLRIKAKNFASSPNETEFEIFVAAVTATGTYPLNSNVSYPTFSASYGYFVKRKFTPEDEWLTNSTTTGSVIITKLDLTNKIVSGTFQFNAASIYTPSNILSVTEGRFDIKLP